MSRVVFPNNIQPVSASPLGFNLCFVNHSTVSEEQKWTAHSPFLSRSITDYFHGLASFGADSQKCFAFMYDLV